MCNTSVVKSVRKKSQCRDPIFRQIDGTAPTFVKKPAIRQEDDGKKLIFECQIKADPGPSVSWSHNSENVKEGPRHKVRYCDHPAYVELRLTEIDHSYIYRVRQIKMTAICTRPRCKFLM